MSSDIEQLREKLFSKEFSKFCKAEFSTLQRTLEQEKRKRIKKSLLYMSLLILLLVVAYSQGINPFFLIIILAVILICGVYPYGKYIDNVKKMIIPKLLSFVGEFEILDPYDKLYRIDKFVKSLRLFDNHNDCSCSDFIVGKYKGLKIRIAEIYLTRESDENKVVVFNGILLSFETTKKFPTDIIIKDNKEKVYESADRVYLEDPEFEKLYDVYSMNQIAARKIITPAFMQRLVKYSRKGKITLSFENGRINIAIKSNKNWFRIPTSSNQDNINVYRKYILDLIQLLSIIEHLKLNI